MALIVRCASIGMVACVFFVISMRAKCHTLLITAHARTIGAGRIASSWRRARGWDDTFGAGITLPKREIRTGKLRNVRFEVNELVSDIHQVRGGLARCCRDLNTQAGILGGVHEVHEVSITANDNRDINMWCLSQKINRQFHIQICLSAAIFKAAEGLCFDAETIAL